MNRSAHLIALYFLLTALSLPMVHSVSVEMGSDNARTIDINSVVNLESKDLELVRNGGFELGFSNWTKFDYYTITSIYLSNDTAHRGEKALLILTPARLDYALGGGVFQDIKGSPTLDLEFSFWSGPYMIGRNPFALIQASAIFETSSERTFRINYIIAWYLGLKTPGNYTMDETDIIITEYDQEENGWIFVKRDLREDFESRFSLNEKEEITTIRVQLDTKIVDVFHIYVYWDDISVKMKTSTISVKATGLEHPYYTTVFFNNSSIKINDGESLDLEYLPELNCTASVQPYIEGNPGVRSICTNNLYICEPNQDYLFQYQTEYLVNVSSKLSKTIGSGWYLKDTVAELSINPTRVEVNGTQYIFKGWVGDIESSEPTISIEMDSPKNIEAVWEPTSIFKSDQPGWLWPMVFVVALVIISMLVIGFLRRYKALQ